MSLPTQPLAFTSPTGVGEGRLSMLLFVVLLAQMRAPLDDAPHLVQLEILPAFKRGGGNCIRPVEVWLRVQLSCKACFGREVARLELG